MSIVWQPTAPKKSRMWQYILFVTKKTGLQINNYQQLYQFSIDKSAEFWRLLAEFFAIKFTTHAENIVIFGQEMFDTKWFPGATFNFAEQLLQRRDSHKALIMVDENARSSTITYQELYILVAKCSAGLRKMGVSSGDRVAAIMPNVANTIIAMLATTSIGAIWSSCSPDFGVDAIVDRVGQVQPRVIFISDGYCYAGKTFSNLEKIQALAKNLPDLTTFVITPIITKPVTENKTMYWQDFLQAADHCQFTALPFAHPVYIMFSSGTTGKPKCIVHGAGGTLLQHLKELALHTNLSENDNLLFYTTCGWMMWNWMVSALALGLTITLYEGAALYPSPLQMFKIIDDHDVSVFGTSAKFISAVEKKEVAPNQHYALKTLRAILSTGSPLLPNNYDFVYQHIKADVQLCSISGGTDIISCFGLGNPLLPVYHGELQCIGLGMAVAIFDENGEELIAKQGELVCTQAFPAMPIYFWNDVNKEKYRQSYFSKFPGVWAHGDFAEQTVHHGLIIYGRSDAVLNPGGVRIGTAEIYRQIEKIDAIEDSVVISQPWQDDVRIILFVKLKAEQKLSDALCLEIKNSLRLNASPRHVPAKIIQVQDIPRTINGKIMEIAVRQTIMGEKVCNFQSLVNPDCLSEYKDRRELKE